MYELLIVCKSVNQQREASAGSLFVYPVETKVLSRQIKLGSWDNSAFLVLLWLQSPQSGIRWKFDNRFPKGTPSSGSHDVSRIVFPHLLFYTHQSCCLGNNRQPFILQCRLPLCELELECDISRSVFRFSDGINNALFWWFWILWYFWDFFLGPFPFEPRCSLSVSLSPPYLELSYTALTVSDPVKSDRRTLRP